MKSSPARGNHAATVFIMMTSFLQAKKKRHPLLGWRFALIRLY
jgi:hypothetical protein